jgi:hypothetical protein
MEGYSVIAVIRRCPKTAAICAFVSLGVILVCFGAVPGAVFGTDSPQPFADLKADIDLDIEDGEFEVMATFTLGKESNGLNPPAETVRLQVTGGSAAFSVTIPAGSFKQDKSSFSFQGTVNRVRFIASIRPLSKNVFEFETEGERVNLKGVANPVTVILTIGDDGGSRAVRAKIE